MEEENNFSIEASWPEQGDKLFAVNKYLWLNAYIKQHPDINWALYIFGYKQAADILVDYLENNDMDANTLVFPVVFLYRQYLELQLKQIIRDGNALLDRGLDFPKTHKLNELWGQCKGIILEVYPENSEQDLNDLEIVEQCILEFSDKDPSSMAFRYPTDKSDQSSLPDNLRYIDLQNLAKVVDKINSLLVGIGTGISEYLNDKYCYS
jgi:hypothetical protein